MQAGDGQADEDEQRGRQQDVEQMGQVVVLTGQHIHRKDQATSLAVSQSTLTAMPLLAKLTLHGRLLGYHRMDVNASRLRGLRLGSERQSRMKTPPFSWMRGEEGWGRVGWYSEIRGLFPNVKAAALLERFPANRIIWR